MFNVLKYCNWVFYNDHPFLSPVDLTMKFLAMDGFAYMIFQEIITSSTLYRGYIQFTVPVSLGELKRVFPNIWFDRRIHTHQATKRWIVNTDLPQQGPYEVGVEVPFNKDPRWKPKKEKKRDNSIETFFKIVQNKDKFF